MPLLGSLYTPLYKRITIRCGLFGLRRTTKKAERCVLEGFVVQLEGGSIHGMERVKGIELIRSYGASRGFRGFAIHHAIQDAQR